MFTYLSGNHVPLDLIYQAFIEGFSDYIMKVDITKDAFVQRFFYVDGNAPQFTCVAFAADKPVGVMLGGIKQYEGVKTLRCGGLCVHPEYRRKGIAQGLFELHKKLGQEHECRQLLLEVIVGNEPAVHFYERQGYEKMYDLHYYSLANWHELQPLPVFETSGVSLDELELLLRYDCSVHLNWQNDIDYFSKLEGWHVYGYREDHRLQGVISLTEQGLIQCLWVAPLFRMRGIGSTLLAYAAKELRPKRLLASFTNNAALTCFYRKHGFTKEKQAQYEMYLFL